MSHFRISAVFYPLSLSIYTPSLTFHKVFKDPLKLSFENFLNGCPQGIPTELLKTNSV